MSGAPRSTTAFQREPVAAGAPAPPGTSRASDRSPCCAPTWRPSCTRAATARSTLRASAQAPSDGCGGAAASCGHEWRTTVRGRSSDGYGCPECARRRRAAQRRVPLERSLAVLHPDLAAELHPTRNGELDPYQVAPMSRRSVWWRCGSCGHEWRTLLSTRVRGSGCPECRRLASIGRRIRVARERSLAALRPDLAAELHPTRNGDLDAFAVARWSVQPVWWRCGSCGHEWRVTPQKRAGCPRCSARRPVARERSLAILRPDLAAELHPTRNGDLDPHQIGASADRSVSWQCRYCGREWQARVAGRLHSPGGCASCAKRRAALKRWRAQPTEPSARPTG